MVLLDSWSYHKDIDAGDSLLIYFYISWDKIQAKRSTEYLTEFIRVSTPKLLSQCNAYSQYKSAEEVISSMSHDFKQLITFNAGPSICPRISATTHSIILMRKHKSSVPH